MKKVLIITLEYPPQVGGIATYVNDLAAAFEPEKCVVLAPKLSRWFWPRWLTLIWKVIRVIKKNKIEVVLVHHILPVGYAAIVARALTGTQYIIFSHGTDIAAAGRRPWKRLMVKLICRFAAQIVMNSESLERRFLLKFSEYQNKTTVLYPCPNSIFLQPANQEKLDQLKNHLAIGGRAVILSIARLVDGKGFPHLVRVIKSVSDRVPNLAWLIVGTGHKLAEIIDLVQKNSLQNIVRFIGEVPHEELPVYFQAGTAFALLTHPDSGFEEGLGLVFLEAAASGLPVVAGKSGGVEEAVLNGQTGYVYDVYQNKIAITEALVTLVTNPTLASKLGAAGKTRIVSEFNWTHQLKVLSPWLD